MGGVRIRHKTLKGVTMVLRDKMEPRIPPPYPVCSKCTQDIKHPVDHEGYKSRHFDIDSEGFTIVSEGVLEELKKFVDLGGFDIENDVPDPPAQTIALGTFNGSGKPVVQEGL